MQNSNIIWQQCSMVHIQHNRKTTNSIGVDKQNLQVQKYNWKNKTKKIKFVQISF